MDNRTTAEKLRAEEETESRVKTAEKVAFLAGQLDGMKIGARLPADQAAALTKALAQTIEGDETLAARVSRFLPMLRDLAALLGVVL